MLCSSPLCDIPLCDSPFSSLSLQDQLTGRADAVFLSLYDSPLCDFLL
jgi:hypothetical protein